MVESYESFYSGGYSTFSPEDNVYTGFPMSASRMGFPGSAQTANQLGETVNAIKQGVKAFEVSLLDMQDVSQAIPKQHFKEMRALMKLTGVKPSVHGPILDPAGFVKDGWGREQMRQENEERIFSFLEKAHMINPEGNIPFVLHASNGAPGNMYRADKKKKGEERYVKEMGFMINQETGRTLPIDNTMEGAQYYPSEYDRKNNKLLPTKMTPEESIRSANSSEWRNDMTELATLRKQVDETISNPKLLLAEYKNKNAFVTNEGVFDLRAKREGDKIYLDKGEKLGDLEDDQVEAYNQMNRANQFLKNTRLKFDNAFHKAYKYGTEEQKKELDRLAKDYSEEVEKNQLRFKTVWGPEVHNQILGNAIMRLDEITSNGDVPKVYDDAVSFARDKATDTFSNLAEKSYEKFGESSPVIAIENPPFGDGMRGSELKEYVDISRKKFVERMVESNKMSRNEAEKFAKEKIGATWDVGHINVLKKQGFTDEDIERETKAIAKDVKHLHMTDNFGFGDSHLAPGMGNVPFKKILETLEKEGRLDEINKIVEAPGVFQHFKKSGHPFTLSAFGSWNYGAKMAPFWNPAMDTVGSYFGGYGTTNPEVHHSMYGAGFSGLPPEVGGVVPGAGGQSRFGGTPMA